MADKDEAAGAADAVREIIRPYEVVFASLLRSMGSVCSIAWPQTKSEKKAIQIL